jgi:hypothetical protein
MFNSKKFNKIKIVFFLFLIIVKPFQTKRLWKNNKEWDREKKQGLSI